MRYYYDLHIHSVLSPCADILMTPNNIFNMATLKGISILSVTDHNSCKQLPICYEIAQSYDLLFIPGIEISVSEGFHVLCYFKRLEDAMLFDQIMESYIKKETYDASYYGEQQLTNIDDEVIDTYPYLLSADSYLSLFELKNHLKQFEHILLYAHVDRTKKSGLSYVHDVPLDGLELTQYVDTAFIENNYLDRYPIVSNSDAHQITDILEQTVTNYMELESLTIDAFFKYFKHG